MGTILGGPWDLVSKVIRALIRVIRNYKYSIVTLFMTSLTKSHDPPRKGMTAGADCALGASPASRGGATKRVAKGTLQRLI